MYYSKVYVAHQEITVCGIYVDRAPATDTAGGAIVTLDASGGQPLVRIHLTGDDLLILSKPSQRLPERGPVLAHRHRRSRLRKPLEGETHK